MFTKNATVYVMNFTLTRFRNQTCLPETKNVDALRVCFLNDGSLLKCHNFNMRHGSRQQYRSLVQ